MTMQDDERDVAESLADFIHSLCEKVPTSRAEVMICRVIPTWSHMPAMARARSSDGTEYEIEIRARRV